MNVLFVNPDSQTYYREFVRGLKEVGATVIGFGHLSRHRVPPSLRPYLDQYVTIQNLFDVEQLVAAARVVGRHVRIDRVETTDETLVVPTAQLRERLGLPGISVETAILCRDKSAMKDRLRAEGIPCAQSAACSSDAEVRAFVEKVSYPIILKPRAGFGSLNTHRVGSDAELNALLPKLGLGDGGRSMAAEEYVDGHEGFYDTIMLDDRVGHEFISHYYPGCLAATLDRSVSPQIAVTNRLDSDGYAELKEVGRKVNRILGITRSATHMEWFFGDKGLKFSEIGARPAGERIWDMYRAANEFDVYREWAHVVTTGQPSQTPSRRFAAGSIQIRPDRDGRYVGHEGLEDALKKCGPWIYESDIPTPGTPTHPLEKGWLVNTWFRLRHPDYDEVRRMMAYLGQTVKAHAR
ncbi:MAG: ATPase [bacterium]|nr:ATPase [Gemmatimonadota bacterium]